MFASHDHSVLTPGNYSAGHEDWFPANPECPNHKAGVPFSSAYADPNSFGQVSCAECFLHSTIVQSINLSCQHLHACSSCAICYSQDANSLQSPPTAPSANFTPPALSGHNPPGAGISPPILRQTSPYIPPGEASPSSNHSSPSQFNHHTRQRRSSMATERGACGPGFGVAPHSYSNPSSRTQTPVQGSLTEMPQHQTHQVNLFPFSVVNETMQPAAKSSKNQERTELPQTNNSDYDEAKTIPTLTKARNEILLNRKRGANDLCEVCGDRASGYHYNALTCEGCKGFFRRSINRKEPLDSCKYGGNCEMDTYTRRKCPECRLKKCKAVGMLEECLLTEIQCRSKRRNRSTRKHKEVNTPTLPTKSTPRVTASKPEENKIKTKETRLTAEEERLTRQVYKAFIEYATDPMLLKGWTTYLHGNSDPPKLCDLATTHVKVLVEFTKKLPGFSELNPEDQIGLLKGSVVEIGLLRNSHSYNEKKGDIDLSVIAKDTGLHKEHFQSVLDFFSKVLKLGLDTTEYGLLASIILFDGDHAYTNDTGRIDNYRDMFINVMKNYSERRKPKRIQIMAKILNLITELRTLYNAHAQMVSNVKEKGELSDLLREVWDIN